VATEALVAVAEVLIQGPTTVVLVAKVALVVEAAAVLARTTLGQVVVVAMVVMAVAVVVPDQPMLLILPAELLGLAW
jgi:hypothetical protein